MGLTALRKRPPDAGVQYDAFQDPENIHDSMQRIWRLAGLAQHGYRGRWSVTALTGETIDGLAKPGGAVPLIQTSLSGRSAEAAVCCALWTAAKGVPGEKPQELRLDRQATVTARIEARDFPDNPRALPLGTVEGVPAKLRAAKGHVQMVLVAEGQTFGTPPAGVDVILTATLGGAFDRLLAMHRHVRKYQEHVDAQWREQWAEEKGQENEGQENGGNENAGKPPFIESQEIRLLTELANPRRYLQPSSFRGQRLGASRPAAEAQDDADNWTGIDRDQFLGARPVQGCDLRRTVLTTDAGIGKTANLEWLYRQINTAGDGRLALLVPINELAGSYDRFLPETLVECFRRGVEGNSAEQLKPAQAELILRRLRDAGQIVLLFDALDQTLADAPAIRTLCEIVSHPDWLRCRVVVAGRPHALVLHWDKLMDHRSIGWRYLQLRRGPGAGAAVGHRVRDDHAAFAVGGGQSIRDEWRRSDAELRPDRHRGLQTVRASRASADRIAAGTDVAGGRRGGHPAPGGSERDSAARFLRQRRPRQGIAADPVAQPEFAGVLRSVLDVAVLCGTGSADARFMALSAGREPYGRVLLDLAVRGRDARRRPRQRSVATGHVRAVSPRRRADGSAVERDDLPQLAGDGTIRGRTEISERVHA